MSTMYHENIVVCSCIDCCKQAYADYNELVHTGDLRRDFWDFIKAKFGWSIIDGDEWCPECISKERGRTERQSRRQRYAEYLKSDHWKSKRQEYFDEHGRDCKNCGKADGTIHVHHKTYERVGCEVLSDLVSLCPACHRAEHAKPKRKKAKKKRSKRVGRRKRSKQEKDRRKYGYYDNP